MKLLHTSDWHLGRQLHGVSLIDDQRHVLTQLVQWVESEHVDVVVIAGDIYDRSVPPAEAVSLLNETLQTLCLALKVTVVIISGNHDGAERLGFGAQLLAASGLFVFSQLDQLLKPVDIMIKDTPLCIYGIPYCAPEQVRHFYQADVQSFDDAHSFLVTKITEQLNPNKRNILLSHCFVDGSITSESERPLSIGGADSVSWQPMAPFDYVALGHLHAPQHKGKETIRYSGSLLKYSFSEVSQQKGVTLVEFEPGLLPSAVSIKKLPLRAKRDMRIIEGEFEQILTNAQADPQKEDYILVRLTDTSAIIDAVGKLRYYYPNILHLEKTGMLGSRHSAELSREQLKRSELDMFADFFEQSHQQKMTQAQQEAMSDIIQTVHQTQG